MILRLCDYLILFRKLIYDDILLPSKIPCLIEQDSFSFSWLLEASKNLTHKEPSDFSFYFRWKARAKNTGGSVTFVSFVIFTNLSYVPFVTGSCNSRVLSKDHLVFMIWWSVWYICWSQIEIVDVYPYSNSKQSVFTLNVSVLACILCPCYMFDKSFK